MAYRHIMVETPARVSISRQQLVVETDRPHKLPLEDVSTLLLESPQSVVTAAALAQMGAQGTALFVCDQQHLPCAVLLPFLQHSRQLKVCKMQMALTAPQKQQLWQAVVKAKIHNQGQCLALCGKQKQASFLFAQEQRVALGDENHVEAASAAYYFSALFGQDFARREQDIRNACLNYGYALLRGVMARTLTVYGFLPVLGIGHCNELNQMNLADDLMEPFRPVVDLFVAANISGEAEELTPSMKRQLINLLNYDMQMRGKRYTVCYAMEKLVQSLAAVQEGRKQTLDAPVLMEAVLHRYE